MIYEDQLPPNITDAVYDEWSKQSIVDGVRMGPELLKPCPFCGGAARLVQRTHDPEAYPPDDLEAIPIWIVECEAWCCVYVDNQAEAISAWNRREVAHADEHSKAR